MTAYYNENDPYCVQWLRNLIGAGLIAPGIVDERDIRDVSASDLAGFDQCHFFAGIGGWSRALRLAAVEDSRGIWTGSCPCQPFSTAGKRGGFADERHLWPAWHWLISVCKPPIILGEQVARSADWQRLVYRDLEALGYAVGCMPVEAASVGAPHLRDRFWLVAHANRDGKHALPIDAEMAKPSEPVSNPLGAELRNQPGRSGGANGAGAGIAGDYGTSGDVADADKPGLEGWRQPLVPECPSERPAGQGSRAGDGWWDIEPDVGRVAHGVPARVAKLRALGNAIVPQVAAELIRAAL